MTFTADTTFSERDPTRVAWWGFSLLVVLAVHAGLALLLLTRQIISIPASPPPAVLIELAPLPSPAPALQQPTPAAAAPAEPPRPKPEPLPSPEPPLKPEPAVKQPRLEPSPAPAPILTMPAPKPKSRPQPKPKPREQAQPKPQPIDRPPPQRSVAPAQPTQVLPAAPAAVSAPAPAAAPTAPQPSPAAAAAARANWQGQLLAWLSRHKRYPRQAQEQGQQGTAHLRFVVDRYGRVLSYSLARSSGFAALDEEVVALIQRAQPLPPPPSELSGAHFELIAPVEFSLRGNR
jgi:protein TonB